MLKTEKQTILMLRFSATCRICSYNLTILLQ